MSNVISLIPSKFSLIIQSARHRCQLALQPTNERINSLVNLVEHFLENLKFQLMSKIQFINYKKNYLDI